MKVQVYTVLSKAHLAVQGNRRFFAKTLFRVTTPVREVTWSDFLLADILTSMAKALSDSERAMCHMMAGPVMRPHASQQVRILCPSLR